MALDPVIVDHMIRHRALSAESKAHARWFGQRRAKLDADAKTLERKIRAMDDDAKLELEALLRKTPSADTFVKMHEALQMARPTTGLGREDRGYLAEVRSYLFDAYEFAALGDFAGAGEQARRAHERLTWMVEKRSRRGVQSSRMLTQERAAVLTELLPIITTIITAVGRVSRG